MAPAAPLLATLTGLLLLLHPALAAQPAGGSNNKHAPRAHPAHPRVAMRDMASPQQEDLFERLVWERELADETDSATVSILASPTDAASPSDDAGLLVTAASTATATVNCQEAHGYDALLCKAAATELATATATPVFGGAIKVVGGEFSGTSILSQTLTIQRLTNGSEPTSTSDAASVTFTGAGGIKVVGAATTTTTLIVPLVTRTELEDLTPTATESGSFTGVGGIKVVGPSATFTLTPLTNGSETTSANEMQATDGFGGAIKVVATTTSVSINCDTDHGGYAALVCGASTPTTSADGVVNTSDLDVKAANTKKAFPSGVPTNRKKQAAASAAAAVKSQATPTSAAVVAATTPAAVAPTTAASTPAVVVPPTTSSAPVVAPVPTTSAAPVVVTPSTTVTPTTTTTKAASTTVYALGGKPASSCAARYTDISNGAIYGPQASGYSGWSPRPTTFVTMSGGNLYLDGKPFTIVGPNIYWLGMDENVYPNPSYPTKGRIREAMAMTVAMGGNTIRCHTLGSSTGTALSVWPKKSSTNLAAFDPIDYSIWASREYGLRLIIPLTDQYAYYHGGKYDFIKWAGADSSNGNLFYTNRAVINLYKEYITVLLSHVNTYTGVALKDDPTILAWETINEGGAYFLSEGAPPAAWTTEIAKHIKSLAPNHLVVDGTDGLVDYSGAVKNTGLNAEGVDIVTDHFYPALNWLLAKDKTIMANTGKNYLVGELDWTDAKGGDTIASFTTALEGWKGAGSMIWSLFGHDAQCCNWVQHNDGYTVSYPNGNSATLQAKAKTVMNHWYRLRGISPPTTMPAVACPQLEL